MVFVAEDNAFVDRAQQVFAGVPGLQPDKGALGVDVDIAAEQEGQEDHAAVLVADAVHTLVGVFVDVLVAQVHVLQDFCQEPFEVAGGGRAAFQDHPVARHGVD